MLDKGDRETSDALTRANKVCRFINIALKATSLVFIVFWLIAAGIMIYPLIGPDSNSSGYSSFLAPFLFIGQGVSIAAMLIVFIKILSDVSKGESPFTMMQVKRLRMIAGLLLLYGFLDFAVSLNTAAAQLSGLDAGYISVSGNAIVFLNFSPLIAAAVVFAFSFVFKYGVLLQELSDDTL